MTDAAHSAEPAEAEPAEPEPAEPEPAEAEPAGAGPAGLKAEAPEPAYPRKSRRRRGLLPAVGLFLLAPLFGEYLLGNLAFSDLALLPFLAVLYGAGALLIRETARRLGRGSATMLTLGVAYALVEEGLVDQMLFNEHYFVGQAQETDTYIGALGIDAWLTMVVVAMHAVWSTYIPIAIMEWLVPDRRTAPWLGPVGTVVTAATFVAGSAWLCGEIYAETGFFAAPAELAGTTAVVVALIAVALRLPRRSPPTSPRPLPSPVSSRTVSSRTVPSRTVPNVWLTGVFAFAVSSLFMLTEGLPGWAEVAAGLPLVLVFAVVVTRWSRRRGFGERHRFALVAGAVVTYAWLGVVMQPETGPRSLLDQIGSFVVVGFALGLLVLSARRLRSTAQGTTRTT